MKEAREEFAALSQEIFKLGIHRDLFKITHWPDPPEKLPTFIGFVVQVLEPEYMKEGSVSLNILTIILSFALPMSVCQVIY
jgi:hypothetical protein